MQMTFANKEPEDEKIGIALKEVMNYQCLRGSFDGINKELRELGVEKIHLGDSSVNFEGTVNDILFSY